LSVANAAWEESSGNRIAGAMLVWCRFKELAYVTGRTSYQIKFGQLSDYLIGQLKSPSLKMALA